MRERLIEAQLWNREDPVNPGQSVCAAWQVLARLGAACRFGGRGQDGRLEYLIVDPADGRLLAVGRGESTPEALCAAALAACPLMRRKQGALPQA